MDVGQKFIALLERIGPDRAQEIARRINEATPDELAKAAELTRAKLAEAGTDAA